MKEKVEIHNRKGNMIIRHIPENDKLFNNIPFYKHEEWLQWNIILNLNYPMFVQILWNKK